MIGDQLTEEQREEIRDVADRMVDEGASPCEVHETVREMVEGFVIELPEDPPRRHRMARLLDQLTEDQYMEVDALVETMTEEGASPREIHQAVRETVEGFGIELPERHGWRHDQGNFTR